MKFILSVSLLIASLSAFATTPAPNYCAVAYNSLDHHYSSTLVLQDGAAYNDLGEIDLSHSYGTWDNKITKVSVRRGCTLIAYQYQNFNRDYHSGRPLHGFSQVFENSSSKKFKGFILGSEANDKISSVKCFCI